MTIWEDHVEEVVAAAALLDGDPADSVARVVRTRFALLTDDARERLRASAIARMTGFGSIGDLIADSDVDEVLVHRGTDVWVERRGRLERARKVSVAETEVVLERMLSGTGRRLDRSHPIVDARLPDGSRLCAVIPPIAVDGPVVALRAAPERLIALDEFGPSEVSDTLRDAVAARHTILVTGAASSGKTTLLSGLITEIPGQERVVVVEDTTELPVRHPQMVRLESRPGGEGLTPVTCEDLVRTALRLRPDRLVVGEIRGSEVVALVQAIDTGHEGALATCHANSAADALSRLESLIARVMPDWPADAARRHLRRCIDLVVHLRRLPTGERRVVEMVRPSEGDRVGPVTRALA